MNVNATNITSKYITAVLHLNQDSLSKHILLPHKIRLDESYFRFCIQQDIYILML